jgi:hypothetical protein
VDSVEKVGTLALEAIRHSVLERQAGNMRGLLLLSRVDRRRVSKGCAHVK